MVKIVTDSTFEKDVAEYKGYVLVDFWAEWCGPCMQMAPVFEKLSKDVGDKIKIFKMNIDENKESPAKCGVRAIPTFVMFKNGETVDTKVGVLTYDAIKKWVDTQVDK